MPLLSESAPVIATGYAQITGRLLHPDHTVSSAPGIRARLTAVPHTAHEVLRLPDAIAKGPALAETDDQGMIQTPLTVPVVPGVLWTIHVDPTGPDSHLKGWSIGPVEITGDTMLDDLQVVEALEVTPQLRESVLDAAARAEAAADSLAIGEPGGVAPVGPDGKVPGDFLPPLGGTLTNNEDGTVAGATTDGGSVTLLSAAETDERLAERVRVTEAPYDPARSGVKSDGATDDTGAWQAALAVVRAANGAVRPARGKTSIISGTLDPTGVQIDGQGHTLKAKPGATVATMLRPTGGCVIEGLTLDGNKANTTDPGSNTQGAGIYPNASTWDGLIIRDLRVLNFAQFGIRLAGGPNITDAANAPLGGTLLDNVRTDGCKTGVYANAISGLRITQCEFLNSATEGANLNLVRALSIVGGRAVGNGGHGWAVQYAHAPRLVGVLGEGNGLSGICFGGGITTYAITRDWQAVGCVSRGNTQHGITIDPTLAGQPATPQKAPGGIVGGVYENNGLHGINCMNLDGRVAITGAACVGNTRDGIALSSRAVVVSGSALIGNGMRGLAMFGNATYPNYGYHQIGVNDVRDNTSGQYFVESASVAGVQWAALTSTNPKP